MDQELIDYLITHYMGLLGKKEKMAQKHYFALQKSDNAQGSQLKEMIIRQWGTNDKEILSLLDNGYEEFKRIAADKILKEHEDQVFINHCPKCGRLARTPFAKQCKHCGHDWH